jgi:hypothetical protein
MICRLLADLSLALSPLPSPLLRGEGNGVLTGLFFNGEGNGVLTGLFFNGEGNGVLRGLFMSREGSIFFDDLSI